MKCNNKKGKARSPRKYLRKKPLKQTDSIMVVQNVFALVFLQFCLHHRRLRTLHDYYNNFPLSPKVIFLRPIFLNCQLNCQL